MNGKNEAGERFRIVVDNIKASGSRTTPQLPRPPAEEIITFYSDRNAKNKMEFKNPVLNQSKTPLDFSKKSTLESTTLIDDNLPPMMRE